VQNESRDKLIYELYQSNYAAVLRLCSGILRNPDDAADAAQEVFLIALESLDRSATRSVARAWLLTVARNHCLDLLRRHKRLGKALTMLGSDTSPGTDMETAIADRDFVDAVFKQLSRRERQALWQSAVESRPLADIAGRLRLSYMAAAQVLHRARRHAVEVAGRVAVVVGVFQWGRQRLGGIGVVATRVAAVVAVPLIVVSVQSSSPVRQPLTGSPAAVSAAPLVGASGVPGGVAGTLHAQVSGLVPGAMPSPNSLVPAPTGTLNSAIGSVSQLLRSLPSVPPVAGTLPVLPSGSALPSPAPLPSLP
jgi:RNA polymerase sigma-70 factor (ECF subfamily)